MDRHVIFGASIVCFALLGGCDEQPYVCDGDDRTCQPPSAPDPATEVTLGDLVDGDPYDYAASTVNNVCDLPPEADYVSIQAAIGIRKNGFAIVDGDEWHTDFETRTVFRGPWPTEQDAAVGLQHQHTHTLQTQAEHLIDDPAWAWAMEVQALRQEAITMLHLGWRWPSVEEQLVNTIEDAQQRFGWTDQMVDDALDLAVRADWCD